MAKEGRNKEFSSSTFYEEQLSCSQCGWKGTGDKANIIDLYNLIAGKEVRCPGCDYLLGLLREEKNDTGNSGDQLGFQIG